MPVLEGEGLTSLQASTNNLNTTSASSLLILEVWSAYSDE